MKSLPITLFFAASLVLQTAIAQEIHKWTDENGVVHYGDQPPSGTVSNAEIVREKPPPKPNRILTTSGAIGEFETAGVTSYALSAGEQRQALAEYVQGLTATGERLWITYPNSVLSFDARTNESTKYAFHHLKLNVFETHITNQYLVLRSRDKAGTTSELNVYDLLTDSYYEVPLETPYAHLVSYNDQYNDGLFLFRMSDGILLRYSEVPTSTELNNGKPAQYPLDTLSYVNRLSTTTNTFWYLGSSKENCSLGAVGKRSGAVSRFSYKDIGLNASDRCMSIVADEKEVWVSVRKSLRSFDARIAIYNIEAESWDVLDKSSSGKSLTVSDLQMDMDRIYFRSRGCTQFVAMDRKTKAYSTIDIQGYRPGETGSGCAEAFTVHGGYLWVVTSEVRARQKYPVLYRIPLHKFDPLP